MKAFSNLSVIIIAKNEEQNLPRLFQSLPKGSELILVDSESQDQTATIAESFGATVYQRAFTNHGDQKNFALSKATRKWVLSVDADEELDPRSMSLLENAIEQEDELAFRLPRHLVFMDRKMRYGKTKDAPLRLFQREKGMFEGAIHEGVRIPGYKAPILKGVCLYHYSYKDLTDYFIRFNRYTSAIATNHRKRGKRVPGLSHILRPWIEFVSRYFFRLGFLDGYPGYTYALVSSLYAYVKYAKLKELGDSKI